MKCLNCNKEINDSAKFCKFCGSPVKEATAPVTTKDISCASCGKALSPLAKFCKYCGTPTQGNTPAKKEEEAFEVTETNVTVQSNFITWHILPGQLAVKIDETEIAAYKTVKGVYITPGTKALFFVNGKLAASLDSGKYAFKDIQISPEARQSGSEGNRALSFLRNIASHIANGVSALFGGRKQNEPHLIPPKTFYSIVLVRGVEFPLVYDLEGVSTKNIRSTIGLHLLCKLTNVNDFFEAQLVDKKMVSIKQFADSLLPSVNTVINRELSAVSPQDVDRDSELQNRVLLALQGSFGTVYPYISVLQIISLTAAHEELEKLRAMKEELYVAELELEQLQLRNDYLNRLQSVEHTNELRMAREQVDFIALMDKIDEDRLLNEDKKAQFVEMLEAQVLLRRAKTEAESFAALAKLEQTKLLSAEELETLDRAIRHRADMDEAAKEHELTIATLQNKLIQDREALRWEIEIGNKIVENDLQRRRMAANFSDERRDADLNFEKRRMDNKMDLLRQAQALREERERATHQRVMEMQKLQSEAELEHHRINATMSFEQIMASNPDITPEAAAALAKKFEADAMVAQNDKTTELMRQHDEDLKAILSQQMALTRDIVASQNQANANAVTAKQQELDRVHEDAEKNQDRFLAGMQTTITAVAGAQKGSSSSAPSSDSASTTIFCPNCGKKHSNSSKICDGCGAAL